MAQGLIVLGQEIGHLVLKGLGCLGSSRGVIRRLRVSIPLKLTSRRRGDWSCSFHGGVAGVSCIGLETTFQEVAVETTHFVHVS